MWPERTETSAELYTHHGARLTLVKWYLHEVHAGRTAPHTPSVWQRSLFSLDCTRKFYAQQVPFVNRTAILKMLILVCGVLQVRQ
jgi:hypothetical protein